MNDEIKNLLRKQSYDLVKQLLLNNENFYLIIWNDNDWNAPLPDRLKSEPQILINVSKNTLKDSYIKKDKIFIVTSFNGLTLERELKLGDILTVTDSLNKPLHLNVFPRDIKIPSKEDILKTADKLGTNKEGIEHSLNMFVKNNPELKIGK